ncbi:MAG TPA: DNA polymerase Y family protein [Candidatus Aquilonibacter sp.]|nr:DNA polymerase Y family protein [Candidatus Aquilonibacter sp.]
MNGKRVLLCLRIPDYPLAVALAGTSSGGDAPLLIADRFDRGRVIALDERARKHGARAGQTVTQAAAAAPTARVAVHDPVRSRAVWNEVLDLLDGVTPLIDDVREGVAFLDMRGIDGTPERWRNQIHTLVQHLDLPVLTGAGPNRFCAYAASWIADGTIIAPGEEVKRLTPLPLDVLDLDPRAQERLHLLGVATLGELARLPHGPFVRRFGREAAVWHEWARGIDRTPFIPRSHAVTIEASMYGEGSAESEEAVVFAIRVLLSRICSDLERCGRRASALELEVELDNGRTQTMEILLAAATANDRDMLDVVRAKLEGVTFDAPLCGLRLRALRLEEGGEMLALVRNDDIDPQNVAVVLARLEALLGEPVRRARTRAAHPSEERFSYEPFTLGKLKTTYSPLVVDDRHDDRSVVPQMRLLDVVEVDVTVTRGEPAAINGERIVQCAGPWRIEEGWFGPAISRDEYDVVLEDGSVRRIYRQGSRWYVRGTYD